MPKWVVALAVLVGCLSFVSGALIGARSTARAGSPQLVSGTASPHVVQRQPPPGSCHASGTGLFSLPDQRGASPNPKDSLEDRLTALVCDGRLSLAAARLAIARNWVTAYRRYVR